MIDTELLKKQIEEQGQAVRKLKTSGGDPAQVNEQVAILLSLKDKLRIASGGSKEEPAKKSSGRSIALKVPKGTKDYTDKEMSLRSKIFNTIVGIFEKHGAVTIDTPVFELKEILTGKYGEDSKLIYDLKDQGGEECSLRYDLTVPFARHVAMNGISNIKRYHIAKVYRRDQPAMTKGRMREFYQCDYDIAGSYDPMIPDAECVRVAVEVLTRLDVGSFVIKLNHRKILDAIFEVSGVPEDKIRSISSAVDKLDKLPWSDVRLEMTQEKGLDGVVADKIGEYVQLKGGEELLQKLQELPELMASKKAQEGVADMSLFFKYARIYGILDRVSFDMSLARGLDYYTGIIYEAVLVEENVRPAQAQPTAKQAKDNELIDESQIRVGSIAAGGRYDELVGMFSAAKRARDKKTDVPCVGISFGIERIFSIIWSRMEESVIKANRTAVYVMSMRDGLLEERMRVATELWDNGIATEFAYKVKPRQQSQYDACDNNVIPWAVIIGKDEIEQGMVRIKNMVQKVEGEKMGVLVKRADMVTELKKRLEETPELI
ncbi:Cytoplasmic and mitochondrial histidine tRNA synthetase [Coemansia spiralis]|uniref:Histidine--tRNA ligase, mitochondrial n=2 Tax=Coemansia TaxID=4863 RepID=A0A9W8GBW4_9FUNG|nr:histidyl-tRNA synthetase [Coemansia spiralis]KAJ1993936.1 Cytoplasmic and mitochondrial histidine tRNA synthetase [Coemansia umbellata]KAJ2622701.1 Cytoplasmic and mitochondrial histidine tRNA synthetase [Coemansia sp. RSA 1358]KAJ2679086.1 Cytoplasmic and mitochondrial histidine tRNA synthetase [Coemansia spiralis]